MEEVLKEVNEFLSAAKNGKGGVEEHRKMKHWSTGLRYRLDIERILDVRKKITLYEERLQMLLQERYGQIDMKSS